MNHKLKKNPKIILPGGAGLVGQNLVVKLKKRGFNNIVVIDKHKNNVDTMRKLHPDLTIIFADLALNDDWAIYFENADYVVMLQAQIGGNKLSDYENNNIISTKNILKVCSSKNIDNIIHVSSSVVNSVANDFYTVSKKKQENLVKNSHLQSLILRPTLMFGWFDRKHLGWLSRFMKNFPIFPIPGNGRFLRQPLYVGDFCNVIISSIENDIREGVYDISGHEYIYYIDIIYQIKFAVKSNAFIIKIPYIVFFSLLWIWEIFDKNPPFTTKQLKALVAKDKFNVIDWPKIFKIKKTPFSQAIQETFNDPTYSSVELDF